MSQPTKYEIILFIGSHGNKQLVVKIKKNTLHDDVRFTHHD